MARNKVNEYTDVLPAGLLERIPKAVWAAVGVAEYLNRRNIPVADLPAAIVAEWQTLYENGIVPQKPICLQEQ